MSFTIACVGYIMLHTISMLVDMETLLARAWDGESAPPSHARASSVSTSTDTRNPLRKFTGGS